MARGRWVPMVVAVSSLFLVANACEGEGDIIAAIEEFLEPVDLKESSKPEEQAAGASAEQVDAIGQADRAIDRGLENKDLQQLDKAVELRPRDARYVLYRGAVEAITGDKAGRDRDVEKAKQLHRAATQDKPADVATRLWIETILDVGSRTLRAYQGDPNATFYAQSVKGHCGTLKVYAQQYGSTPEGQLYLQFADTSMCT